MGFALCNEWWQGCQDTYLTKLKFIAFAQKLMLPWCCMKLSETISQESRRHFISIHVNTSKFSWRLSKSINWTHVDSLAIWMILYVQCSDVIVIITISVYQNCDRFYLFIVCVSARARAREIEREREFSGLDSIKRPSTTHHIHLL